MPSARSASRALSVDEVRGGGALDAGLPSPIAVAGLAMNSHLGARIATGFAVTLTRLA
jgi:hypothetical protein